MKKMKARKRKARSLPCGDSKVEGGELVRRGREDGERDLLFAVLGEELLVTGV